MKRLIVVVAVLVSCWFGTEPPNDSGDGRFQSCGIVTEEGVTEHLGAYAARCGQ